MGGDPSKGRRRVLILLAVPRRRVDADQFQSVPTRCPRAFACDSSELQQAEKLIERGFDALILVGENRHAELGALLRNNDTLCVNTFVYNPSTHGTCIGPDNRKALYRLTSYLADLGHRCFGVVAQSTENKDRAQARLKGIRDALAERALAIRAEHFAEGL